jgi:hypothetical protein
VYELLMQWACCAMNARRKDLALRQLYTQGCTAAFTGVLPLLAGRANPYTLRPFLPDPM